MDERWFGGVEVMKKDKIDEGWKGEMHEWILWAVLQINHNYMDIVRYVLENWWQMIWRSWSKEKKTK